MKRLLNIDINFMQIILKKFSFNKINYLKIITISVKALEFKEIKNTKSLIINKKTNISESKIIKITTKNNIIKTAFEKDNFNKLEEIKEYLKIVEPSREIEVSYIMVLQYFSFSQYLKRFTYYLKKYQIRSIEKNDILAIKGLKYLQYFLENYEVQ